MVWSDDLSVCDLNRIMPGASQSQGYFLGTCVVLKLWLTLFRNHKDDRGPDFFAVAGCASSLHLRRGGEEGSAEQFCCGQHLGPVDAGPVCRLVRSSVSYMQINLITNSRAEGKQRHSRSCWRCQGGSNT